MTGSKLQKKLSSPLLISKYSRGDRERFFFLFVIIDFNFLLKISPRWSISVNKIYINYRMFNIIQLLYYPEKEISFTLPRRRDDEPHSWEKKKINIVRSNSSARVLKCRPLFLMSDYYSKNYDFFLLKKEKCKKVF